MRATRSMAYSGTPRTPFFEGCSPSPLAPSYASAAAADPPGAVDVGDASASAKSHNSKGKGGRGGGGGSGVGGGGSSGDGGGSGGGGSGGSGGGSGGSGGGSGGSSGSGNSGSGESGGGRTGAQCGGSTVTTTTDTGGCLGGVTRGQAGGGESGDGDNGEGDDGGDGGGLGVAYSGTPRTPFFEGCSPSPLAPSYASAAAADPPGAVDVGDASASAKRHNSKGKGDRGGGGGSGGGGGGSSGDGGGSGGGGSGGSGGGSGGSGGGSGGSGGSGNSGSGASGGGRTGAQCGGSHRCFFRLDDAWRAEFGGEAECPRWAELLRFEVAIFDLDYDSILAAMYALSVSAEGDCYLCVPPDPGIEAAALVASESALLGTVPAEALHTFTLDSDAAQRFFRDNTTLTPLSALVPVRLADPSGLRLVLTGHADASWVDGSATQWLSHGYTFSLGSDSVSWRSTRSSLVLISSCEAETYAGAMAAQELCLLTYLLTDLGERTRSPSILYADNKAMIALCQEHRLKHRTKHIALQYFLARDLQQRGQYRLPYVATTDIFTKALPPGPGSSTPSPARRFLRATAATAPAATAATATAAPASAATAATIVAPLSYSYVLRRYGFSPRARVRS
ncbi:unnamed protein product [Closterium sp. NIES-54]